MRSNNKKNSYVPTEDRSMHKVMLLKQAKEKCGMCSISNIRLEYINMTLFKPKALSGFSNIYKPQSVSNLK